MSREKECKPPSMIIGLDGWGNAGEASTITVSYLIDKLKARKVGEIESDEFYNYQISRPFVSIEGGLIKRYDKLRNVLYEWRGDRIVIILKGVEPHLNWSRYVDRVFEYCLKYRVKEIYTLGGYLVDPSYGKTSVISGLTNNPEKLKVLKECGVEPASYEGATSVYSEILWKSKKYDIDTVSLWVATSVYIDKRDPAAALRLLKTLTCLLSLKVDLSEMVHTVRRFKAELVKEAEEDPKLRELTESLYPNDGSWSMPPYTV